LCTDKINLSINNGLVFTNLQKGVIYSLTCKHIDINDPHDSVWHHYHNNMWILCHGSVIISLGESYLSSFLFVTPYDFLHQYINWIDFNCFKKSTQRENKQFVSCKQTVYVCVCAWNIRRTIKMDLHFYTKAYCVVLWRLHSV